MGEDAARLWITGTGLVTPLGRGVSSTWSRLVAGERAIGPLSLFDTAGQRSTMAAEVRGIVLPEDGASAKSATREAWSRTSVMALEAAREAMVEAKLDVDPARVGLVVGGTTGGMFETEALLAELHANPHARDVLLAMLSHPLTATGDRLNEQLGPFARVRTLCSACSSGANAFIVAAGWLLTGEVDAVVAGGSDALCRLTFTGFNALGAIDTEACRPFHRHRRGLTLGEGAGFVVLERASSAMRRGAKPIAELAGWALGAEAHHITNPEPTGEVVADLLRRAIARAGLTPREVDYVNAHGTGTPLNDPMEAGAIARALGPEVERVPVSSSKGQIGHTLGAAGALEGVVTALTVARQTLVPTAALDDPDPTCTLHHVPHVGRSARVRAAVSNSFGYGGMDTVLVFTEVGLGAPPATGRTRVFVTGAAALTPQAFLTSEQGATLLAEEPTGHGVTPSDRWPADRLSTSRPLPVDQHLDLARARRLDRPARIGAVVTELALKDAGADAPGTGAILGGAFGSVDASAAFMHRLFEKGPRFASPAEFPNLVPSSPVGHVSIYLGLRGPVFATADLSASGESAIAQAAQLLSAGEGGRIVAGAAEERSSIVERILVTLFARSQADVNAPRAEGGAAVVLETEAEVAARNARVLAELAAVYEWREGTEAPLARLAPPRDPARGVVVLPRPNGGVHALLGSTAWRGVRRLMCAPHVGEHDGLGAVAVAAAASFLHEGHADEALVIGLAKGRGYALALTRPPRCAGGA